MCDPPDGYVPHQVRVVASYHARRRWKQKTVPGKRLHDLDRDRYLDAGNRNLFGTFPGWKEMKPQQLPFI